MTLRESTDDLVPQCERCWIDQNSVWELDGVDSTGNVVMRLISVQVPIELTPGAVNECFTCDRITVAGIYVPHDQVCDHMEEQIDETTPEEPE